MSAIQDTFDLLGLPLELQLNVLAKVHEESFVLKARRAARTRISWLGSALLAPLLTSGHIFQQAFPFYRNPFTPLNAGELSLPLKLCEQDVLALGVGVTDEAWTYGVR